MCCRLDGLEGLVHAVQGGGRARTLLAAGAQPRPLVFDDRSDVRRDGGAHPIGLGSAQGLVVAHDCGESVRLRVDVAARVIVVLKLDHDDECEEQAKERCENAEHRRDDLGVELLPRLRDIAPDQPDGQHHATAGDAHHRDQKQSGRHVVENSPQHRPPHGLGAGAEPLLQTGDEGPASPRSGEAAS